MSDSAKVVIWVGCKGWHNFDAVPDEVLERHGFSQFILAEERVEGIIVYTHDWDEGISEINLSAEHGTARRYRYDLRSLCIDNGIDPDIVKTYIQCDIR